MKLDKLTVQILGRLRVKPMTAEQLGTSIGIDRWKIDSRINTLARAGLVEDTGERQTNESNMIEPYWTAQGRAR